MDGGNKELSDISSSETGNTDHPECPYCPVEGEEESEDGEVVFAGHPERQREYFARLRKLDQLIDDIKSLQRLIRSQIYLLHREGLYWTVLQDAWKDSTFLQQRMEIKFIFRGILNLLPGHQSDIFTPEQSKYFTEATVALWLLRKTESSWHRLVARGPIHCKSWSKR